MKVVIESQYNVKDSVKEEEEEEGGGGGGRRGRLKRLRDEKKGYID